MKPTKQCPLPRRESRGEVNLGLITFYQSQQSKDDFWLHIAPAILMVNAIATVCGQINDAAPRSKPQLHIFSNDSCCTVNSQTYSLLHGLSNQHDQVTTKQWDSICTALISKPSHAGIQSALRCRGTPALDGSSARSKPHLHSKFCFVV